MSDSGRKLPSTLVVAMSRVPLNSPFEAPGHKVGYRLKTDVGLLAGFND
jgi:hypothetical protein